MVFHCKLGNLLWIDVMQEWDQWRFIVNAEAGSGLIWYRKGDIGVSL